MKLTDLSIRKLPLLEKGQKIHYDDSLPGFGIRVSKKHKTFVVMYGRERRLKSFGRYPDVSLQTARNEAKRFLATPAPPASNKITYAEAAQRFLNDIEERNRPETIRQYRRHLNAFGYSGRLEAIRRADIQTHLKEYRDRKAAYMHALATMKVFFNWCLRQELIDRHPIMGEPILHVPPRERVLSLEELHALYAYDYPHFSTIVKLCMLTGQRRSEIAAIQPDWIENDTLTLPASVTKNKRTHTIPLTDTTLALLADCPFGKDGGLFNGWSNGKRRIDAHVPIEHWTLHDLRRTFSTIQAQLSTPIHVTERILNHSTGSISGVIAVYNRHSYLDEMRTALERYEQYVLE